MKTFWRWFRPYWMRFARALSWVKEHLLLGFVYWVVIGIYALIYDFLTLFKRKPKTMWRKFEHQPTTLETLEKQF